MSKITHILDASAILCLINKENGCDIVNKHLSSSAMSTVNISEVITVLTRVGININDAIQIIQNLIINAIDFNFNHASIAGELYNKSKNLGLSLGDRACLSLASHMKLPVITADSVWKQLQSDIKIICIR